MDIKNLNRHTFREDSMLLESEKNEKSYKELFRTYCAETSLHGFGFENRAKHWTECVAWLCIIVFCFVMAGRDTAILVQQFRGEATSTVVKIITEKNVTLEPPVVCAEIMYHYMRAITNISRIEKLLTNFTDLIDIINNPVNDSHHVEIDNELVNLFTALLTDITGKEGEYFAAKYKRGRWGGKYAVYAYSEKLNTTTLSELNVAINRTHSFLVDHNVSFSSLAETVGALLCKRMGFIVFFSGFNFASGKVMYEVRDNLCTRKAVTFLGSSGAKQGLLCLTIKDVQLTFSSANVRVSIITRPQALYAMSSRMTADHLSETTLWVDFNGNNHIDFDRLDNVIDVPYGKQVQILLEITGMHKAYNAISRPCSTDITNRNCRRTCRANLIRQRCGCWPLQFNDLSHYGVTSCADDNTSRHDENGTALQMPYAECLDNKNTTDNPAYLCEEQCARDCNYKKLSFFPPARWIMGPLDTHNFTVLTMKIHNYVYPLYEEILLMDWGGFLASFGGCIGLWLGASIVAFVHIPIFVVRELLVRTAAKTRSYASSQSTNLSS